MKVADLFARLSIKPDMKSFELGDRLITRLKQGIAGFIAYSTINWAKGLIQQTVELGGAIADLSQKVGVPAETLQQLGYAAQLSGGSMESLGNSLGKLAKLASDAGKGSKEASSTFSKMGVRVKEADGSLRPVEDLLGDIADHISSLPDGTEKTAKAMAVFGRSGKDLIPLLNEGREGIDKLRKEFVDLGAQIDGETASALEAFGDEQDKISVAFTGIRNQIVIGILPYLKEMVSGWVAWFKANRQLIRLRIEQFLKVLSIAFKILVKLAAVAFDVIGGVIQLFVEWVNILLYFWDNFQMVIAGAIGMFLALKAAAISTAVAAAAAWALPLAAIAAIALLGEDVWQWANGGESALKDIHEGLVRLFVEAIEFWVQKLEEFFLWFDKKVEKAARVIRETLPSWAGGYSDAERRQNFASDAGVPNAKWNDPELAGLDFFSPEYDQKVEEIARREEMARAGRISVADLPIPLPKGAKGSGSQVVISAPITVNGATGQDPNEIARIVQVKLEGILRTASSATED